MLTVYAVHTRNEHFLRLLSWSAYLIFVLICSASAISVLITVAWRNQPTVFNFSNASHAVKSTVKSSIFTERIRANRAGKTVAEERLSWWVILNFEHICGCTETLQVQYYVSKNLPTSNQLHNSMECYWKIYTAIKWFFLAECWLGVAAPTNRVSLHPPNQDSIKEPTFQVQRLPAVCSEYFAGSGFVYVRSLLATGVQEIPDFWPAALVFCRLHSLAWRRVEETIWRWISRSRGYSDAKSET